MSSICYDFKSFSKINFGLRVLNKRSDNFHNIESIFIELNFYDILTFSPSSIFKLTCNNKSIPINQKNTIFQSYHKLKNIYNFDVDYHIHLKKNIPIESGLGGGSSNAACTIKALNQLLGLNIDKETMYKYALDIGSDVPFFIDGGMKFIKGRGEIIEKIKNHDYFKDLYFLIVCPEFSISTQWAYGKLKKALKCNDKQQKFPTLDERLNWK